jgi:small subunit ribosomal protein S20
MANHKSAIKRNRQNQKIRARNVQAKSACRTAVKKARTAIDTGDKKVATDLVKKAEKILATAANKKLYHKNNVARTISRLNKKLSTLS